MSTSFPYLGPALSEVMERVVRLKNGDATHLPVTHPDHVGALEQARQDIVDAMVRNQEGFHGQKPLRLAMYRAQESLASLERGPNAITNADQRLDLHRAKENLNLAVAIAEGRTVGMSSIRSPNPLS